MSKKVKNINGTSRTTCKCGSWLKHWMNFSGRPLPKYCAEKSCINIPKVGAHVQRDSVVDKNWYIIPLCKFCNAKLGHTIEIGDSIILVSANIQETCG